MSYRGIGDVVFTEKRTELMDARYTILDFFADPRRFLNKLLKSTWRPSHYEMMSLHALVA